MWIARFAADGLCPQMGRLDMRLCPRTNVLHGDYAIALLKILRMEVCGELGALLAGSTLLEVCGEGVPRVQALDGIPPSRRARLHEAWVREFCDKGNRGSARAARLRSAWKYLWGNSAEQLWAVPGKLPLIASWEKPYDLDEAPRPPRALLSIETRGSGFQAAFDLLGSAALCDADILLVAQPNQGLHFRIAQRVFWALEMAAPGIQIIGAVYDSQLACAETTHAAARPAREAGAGSSPWA